MLFRSGNNRTTEASRNPPTANQSINEKTRLLRSSYHSINVYFICTVMRLLTEITMMTIQITVYGLFVSEIFECQEWPCPNTVICFVSRPKEKSIFLNIMLISNVISLSLNVFEVIIIKLSRSTIIRAINEKCPQNVKKNSKGAVNRTECRRRYYLHNKYNIGTSSQSSSEATAVSEKGFETNPKRKFPRSKVAMMGHHSYQIENPRACSPIASDETTDDESFRSDRYSCDGQIPFQTDAPEPLYVSDGET